MRRIRLRRVCQHSLTFTPHSPSVAAGTIPLIRATAEQAHTITDFSRAGKIAPLPLTQRAGPRRARIQGWTGLFEVSRRRQGDGNPVYATHTPLRWLSSAEKARHSHRRATRYHRTVTGRFVVTLFPGLVLPAPK